MAGRRQLARPGPVDLERAQVALVDADQRGAGGQGPVELGLVVHLDQRVEARGRRPAARNVVSSVSVEGGHDQQHGVGAHEPGVAHVGLADGEVLAQHRQVDGAGLGQVVGAEPPKNSASVSTDRQAAPPPSA